ncbi:hypothetical protein FB567DRAFT_340418 [Paraphoma chrysanthemicola]|uniref:Uncharacterized protein n=1 Tax=Paraphoma chrysanthemicola TaxID=798071 RepID=A0A8K0R7C8_9PLEO|nr:hypothetical protein FB567DRAFT_340418 [Paraphoma chrysanthemicola]
MTMKNFSLFTQISPLWVSCSRKFPPCSKRPTVRPLGTARPARSLCQCPVTVRRTSTVILLLHIRERPALATKLVSADSTEGASKSCLTSYWTVIQGTYGGRSRRLLHNDCIKCGVVSLDYANVNLRKRGIQSFCAYYEIGPAIFAKQGNNALSTQILSTSQRDHKHERFSHLSLLGPCARLYVPRQMA